MKILTINDLGKKIVKSFNKDKISIIIYTILFGFLANIIIITSDILTADAIAFSEIYMADAWDLSIGRWALHLVDYLRFGITSPLLSSLLSLIYLSLMVALLIDLFKIKDKFSQYLFASIAVCCPFFYETLFSTFCSSEFILACLLSTLAVYIIYKKNNNFKNILLSSILIAISLGLYQAHIAVATTLCILIPIVNILINAEDFKNVMKKILFSIIMGILGVILYELILHGFLHYFNVELASYSGADSIGLNNLLILPQLIVKAYKEFYYYFFTDQIVNNLIYKRNIVNGVCFILIFISILIHIYNLYKEKKLKKINLIVILICIIIAPICFSMVEIIAPERSINQLMSSSFLIFYLLILSLIQFSKKNNITAIFNWIGYLCCIYIFITYISMANASYMAVRMTTNDVVTNTSKIINNIYDNDEYTIDMPILIAGNGGNEGYLYRNYSPIYNYKSGNTANAPLVWSEPFGVSSKGWKNLINHYLGRTLNIVDYDDYDLYMKIINTEEFAEMPLYPNKEAIKVIDNVIVVKLNENPTQVL